MIEFLAGLSGLLAVLFVSAVIYAVTYRRERDDAVKELGPAYDNIAFLSNRIEVIRGDNLALEDRAEKLATANQQLIAERDQAVRELGRLKAEKVAAKPKRGPNGRFVPKKPKPEAPKSASKIKPVACG